MNPRTTIVLQRLVAVSVVASMIVLGATMAVRPSGANASLPSPTRPAVSQSPRATPSNTAAPAPDGPQPTTTPRAPRSGDAAVISLQRHLAALGYDVGIADGRIGERTFESVMAFQKVEGLARTGRTGPEVAAALAKANPPRPLVPDGEATRVEIDSGRQVLLFWDHGRLARILPVSTGSGRRYCVAGVCQAAITPRGTFRIGHKVAGADRGPLGPLYYPMYFNGGIAIHGAPSVPATRASHGCARIPMYAAASFFDQVPSGTAVYVV